MTAVGMVQNETILTVGLMGVAIYFSVLVVRGIAWLLRFRRVRRTALVTWPSRRPAHFPLLVGLGLLSAGLAILIGLRAFPFHHVYSQGVMALYFVFLVPLLSRIPLGLYRDGIWADGGFLPYERIRRWAFRETPEIVLILLPRGSTGSFRLPVPPAEYGAVRKVLEEKARTHVMNVEAAILGL